MNAEAKAIEPLYEINEYTTQRYLTDEEINETWLRAIYETHQILIDEGLIQVAA